MSGMGMHRLRAGLLGLLLGTGSVQAGALPPLTENEAYQPILVDGENLPMALGLPLSELSLAAVVDDRLEPVPYQIDPYNTGGAPFFPGWDMPQAGTPGQLNPADKLLFLYKDAGPRRSDDLPVDGEVLAEIRLRDVRDQFRYLYLIRHARLRADEQYVRYSPDLGQVETDFYSLRYNRRNHLQWEDLQFTSYVGERPLDSMSLSVSGGVLAPQLRMELTQDDMVAEPVGAIIGPIRTTTQSDFRVHFLGMELVRFSLQIHHYPKAVVYDLRGVMPAVLRQFAARPTVSMAVDANGWQGAEVRTSALPDQVAKVDGQLDIIDHALRRARFDTEPRWILINSKRRLDVLAFMDYVGEFNEPLSLLFEDDARARESGDRFPGHLPLVGYRIDHLPARGNIGVVASIFFSSRFDGDPVLLARQLRTPPELSVRPVAVRADVPSTVP